jgi:antitoxin component of RelBE/YafQ-DinJ toxin-antitoxin module
MPNIELSFSCNDVEYNRFKKLCDKQNLTTEQGLQLLVRQAVDHNSLPLEYDYDCPEHVQRQIIPDRFKEFLIPMEKFVRMIEQGIIMDYDGFGFVSDGEYEYYSIICDSSWLKEQPERFTHVIWYNR